MTLKTSNLELSEQRIPQLFFAQSIAVAAKTLMVFADFFSSKISHFAKNMFAIFSHFAFSRNFAKMYYLLLGRVCSERNVSQKMQKFSFTFCKLFRVISHFFRVNEGNEKMRNFTKKFVKCERKLLHFLRNVSFAANPT